MTDPVLSPMPCMPEPGHEEALHLQTASDDGHEFLDTTAGLFSASQQPPPGLSADEVRRPGSSLFAWRDLFRS